MTDYVDVLQEYGTPPMSKVAPKTYDQHEQMAKEIAELRGRLADMKLAFEGAQQQQRAVTRPEVAVWRYECPAGEYYNTSLLGLCWDIITHRAWHWRRGDGWVD